MKNLNYRDEFIQNIGGKNNQNVRLTNKHTPLDLIKLT